MFITFEGIDGSGKTTQSKLLTDYLCGYNVVLTREPGGTDFAEKIREVLLTNSIDHISELLVFLSMRQEHMKKLILPSLQAGKVVICDRFVDSTVAYQGYGLGVDLKLIEKLHSLLNIRYPDATFILDVDIKIALQRAKDRNKYEKMGCNFYNRVRKGFHEIAANNQHRCYIITEAQKVNAYNKITNIMSNLITQIPR